MLSVAPTPLPMTDPCATVRVDTWGQYVVPKSKLQEFQTKILMSREQHPNFRMVGRYYYGRLGNSVAAMRNAYEMAYCCAGRLELLPQNDFPKMHTHLDFTANAVARNSSNPLCQGFAGDARAFYYNINVTALPQNIINVHRRHNVSAGPPLPAPGCRFDIAGALQYTLLNLLPGGGCDVNKAQFNRAQLGCGNEMARDTTLVLHIRSGDIFGSQGVYNFSRSFFQPPVYFYQQVLRSRPWQDVIFVTSPEKEERFLNPVWRYFKHFPWKTGMMGVEQLKSIKFQQSQDMMEDFRRLICAQNLVMAKSSFSGAAMLLSPYAREYFVNNPDRCHGALSHASDAPDRSVHGVGSLRAIKCTYIEVPGSASLNDEKFTNSHEQLAALLFATPPLSDASIASILSVRG